MNKVFFLASKKGVEWTGERKHLLLSLLFFPSAGGVFVGVGVITVVVVVFGGVGDVVIVIVVGVVADVIVGDGVAIAIVGLRQ